MLYTMVVNVICTLFGDNRFHVYCLWCVVLEPTSMLATLLCIGDCNGILHMPVGAGHILDLDAANDFN